MIILSVQKVSSHLFCTANYVKAKEQAEKVSTETARQSSQSKILIICVRRNLEDYFLLPILINKSMAQRAFINNTMCPGRTFRPTSIFQFLVTTLESL